MILIKIKLVDSVLQDYTSTGHAKDPHICGAVSSIGRTYARILQEEGQIVQVSAPVAGSFEFHTKIVRTQYFIGMAHLLIRALTDLADEHPQEVNVELTS